MSAQSDTQKDLLKLYAYGTLANFWVTVGAKDAVDEDEAQAFLQLQQSLIKQVDQTLEAHLDEDSMEAFRKFVSRYRIRTE
jgi:hypothetical protein